MFKGIKNQEHKFSQNSESESANFLLISNAGFSINFEPPQQQICTYQVFSPEVYGMS